MRLGVLEFGSVPPATATLLDALRAKDFDVVAGESVVDSLSAALTEAKRLFRADCDGVLLVAGEGSAPETVSTAALLLAGVPLLLAGFAPNLSFFDAVGALESIGAHFDRAYFANGKPDPAAFVEAWLRENAKKERHRGLEAARKLYGQRLYVPRGTGNLPDAALWMHQFGVIVTTEAEGVDFAALTGDTCGALTDYLLALIAGVPANSPVSILAEQTGDPGIDATDVTFARITRTKGRFRCLLLRGSLRDDGSTIAHFRCSQTELFAAASSPLLHAVAGNHLGAMRAACEALGIQTVLLGRM